MILANSFARIGRMMAALQQDEMYKNMCMGWVSEELKLRIIFSEPRGYLEIQTLKGNH